MPGHNNWYRLEQADNQNFKISFSPKPFKKLSVKEAAALTVKRMSVIHNNIWIALSGGYDSEFVATSFYENNVNFTPIIWKYPTNMECDYALYWCRQRDITPHIITRDIVEPKFNQLLRNMVKRHHSRVWFGGLTLYMAEIANKHNGSLVTGTGVITTDNPYPEPIGPYAEFCQYEFFVDFTNQHLGSFMLYSQELMYAILCEIDQSAPTQEVKSAIYNLPFRPKIRPYNFLKDTFDTSNEIDMTYKFEELKTMLEKYII